MEPATLKERYGNKLALGNRRNRPRFALRLAQRNSDRNKETYHNIWQEWGSSPSCSLGSGTQSKMGRCPSARVSRAQRSPEIEGSLESAISAVAVISVISTISATFAYPNGGRLIGIHLGRSLLEVVLWRRLIDLSRGLIGIHLGRRLVAIVLWRRLIEDLWRLGGETLLSCVALLGHVDCVRNRWSWDVVVRHHDSLLQQRSEQPE